MANSPGTNRLARVIAGRIREEAESPLVLDFGEIKKDWSLVTNTFPVPVPKRDYVVDARLLECDSKVKPGSRVLVAWVADTPVIVCAIASGKKLK